MTTRKIEYRKAKKSSVQVSSSGPICQTEGNGGREDLAKHWQYHGYRDVVPLRLCPYPRIHIPHHI